MHICVIFSQKCNSQMKSYFHNPDITQILLQQPALVTTPNDPHTLILFANGRFSTTESYSLIFSPFRHASLNTISREVQWFTPRAASLVSLPCSPKWVQSQDMDTPLQEITLIPLIGAGNTVTREGGERKTQWKCWCLRKFLGRTNALLQMASLAKLLCFAGRLRH